MMDDNAHLGGSMPPALQNNMDYVISDYMERLGTRLNILETELKYAWRALDLLSQEYIKMWERLEKLENLLYEQQSVIGQLLDFYTSGSSGRCEAGLGELEVIREILGNGTVEDGLEEGVDATVPMQSAIIQEIDGINAPDEAFYRSLNQAYREDLVVEPDIKQQASLGLIWEEEQEIADNDNEKNEIYTSLDYKDYRGDSPCVSEQDIAQLSRIDSIDHVAIEQLNELDRLSTKLKQDSINIQELQRQLLESPTDIPPNNQDELLLMSKSELTIYNRPSSRLSVTEIDNEVAETLGVRTPTSPRRRQSDTAPYTTVTGRLAYNNAVQNVEAAEAAAAAAAAASNPFLSSKNPFYNSEPFETVHCSTPSIFSVKSERVQSPALSICSIRTRKDGYVGTSGSPPPPAPDNTCGGSVFQLKSIKTSPKRSKSLNTAKSDSGLSSMSGWSSLEKSPGSPKNKHLSTAVLPGGHHLSAFTTVKSPCSLETSEGYGTFVPAPAPASDINVSPRSKPKQPQHNVQNPPAIYSTAGGNTQQTYTNSDFAKYPDLIEPYGQQQTSSRRRSLNRTYSTSNGSHLTDALSYYPTSSSRFEPPPPAFYVSNAEQDQYPIAIDSASTSSSKETAESSPYLDHRRHSSRNGNQRQDLELDLQNRNVPEKLPKKLRRGKTLKSAMNSVSHWLPDLHLSKRNRSYSLPGNSATDEVKPNSAKNMFHKRKKKIVSTVSGILQKAKRKSFHSAHSLSDPEQSENEWSINRASSMISEDDRSEDSYSMFSEVHSANESLFPKINSAKPKKETTPPSEGLTFETVKLSPMPSHGQQESITPKTDQDTDISDHFDLKDEEISGKSTGSGSSNIFVTVGDIKKTSSTAPSEKSEKSEKSEDSSGNESKSFPPVTLGGASMEFAVSRALGKYRQRQTSSSITDEIDEMPDNGSKKVPEQKSTDSCESNREPTEGSPASSFRSGHRLARHQQSLEIPGMRGENDEDNRSMHSWRSTSRVSSRRQSTEDSIDSEDEWYCYELKKLEELERQTQLEQDMGSTLQEVEENEDLYEPDESVKEKMSFVLRELRMHAKVQDDILTEAENNHHVLASAQARAADIKIIEPEPEPEPEEDRKPFDYDDASSGATSGPDSPRHSISEFEEAESAIADEFARCKPSTTNDAEIEEEIAPADVPKIKIDVPVSVSKEDMKDTGPLGSKWKLLKALKERKAEEKSNQEKVSESTSTEREKVGMLGMMQKFYEIHVRT